MRCYRPSSTIEADRAPRHGLTQQETADKLGVSKRRIQQIEKRAITKLRRALERAAAAMGITEEEWLGGCDD